MILLPENTQLKREQTSLEKTLTVLISSIEPSVLCTYCDTPSPPIHSRYQRHLSDLPVSGHPAKLIVQVRRFFCKNPSCSHKTFAEAFLPLAGRYAQRTKRLQETLQQLALSLGGQAGAKIGTRIGLPSSPSSLLRLIRKAQLPSPAQPATCVGIDDWAYKRRRRYGTLICDLETGKPLELLPDRTVQTVSAWFQEHPEITIISRDRWSEYATAAQKGAPQARQVADRWHLLHNLTQSGATVFPRIRAELNPSGPSKSMSEPSAVHQARQQQYQDLLTLSEQGQTPEQIAPLVGRSERTVYRWLAHANAPSGQHHTRSRSVMESYQAYVLKRWQQGCRKGSELCRELKAQGYRGSERAVYRYLTFLEQQSVAQEGPTVGSSVLSSKKTTWLLVKEASKLDEEEQEALTALRQTSPTAETLYPLVQDFGQMVRLRQGERLDQWLEKVEASTIAELHPFASGIQRDKVAVLAGLTLPYSNGLLEGHVNRLKLIKRSMYGRANFDLLRRRVLSAA